MSEGYDDYDDYGQTGAAGDERAARPEPPVSSSKISVPAALMITTGVVNLLVGGIGFFVGFTFQHMPREEFEKAYAQQNPEQRKQLEQQGWSLDDLLNIYVRGGYGVGIAGLIGAMAAIIGGICMLARKARGLAILASLLTAIPLTSPCCLFGMPIGIWSLVVLLNSDVKEAFG